MFTDPIQVVVSTPPDRFLGWTGTAWTAISSCISAISVIALVVFNWRYLHWTRKMSEAAATQAATAQTNLQKLEQQINANLDAERHAALAVLRQAQNRVSVSAVNFRHEYRSEQNPFKLIPDDRNVLVAYVSRHLPDASACVTSASIAFHNCEGELNRLMMIPTTQRGPNSSLQVRYNSLATNLDNLRKTINDINDAFMKKVIPAS
jgi:hypothetical protein